MAKYKELLVLLTSNCFGSHCKSIANAFAGKIY